MSWSLVALMGSSGTSVEHLHFEAPPGNSKAVNRHPFMAMWQRVAAGGTPPAPP